MTTIFSRCKNTYFHNISKHFVIFPYKFIGFFVIFPYKKHIDFVIFPYKFMRNFVINSKKSGILFVERCGEISSPPNQPSS